MITFLGGGGVAILVFVQHQFKKFLVPTMQLGTLINSSCRWINSKQTFKQFLRETLTKRLLILLKVESLKTRLIAAWFKMFLCIKNLCRTLWMQLVNQIKSPSATIANKTLVISGKSDHYPRGIWIEIAYLNVQTREVSRQTLYDNFQVARRYSVFISPSDKKLSEEVRS